MAASEKQIAANRRNAQKSTGPRTTEGKSRSRENALTHGLRSHTVIYKAVRHEDPDQFLALRNETIEAWNPASAKELQLAEMIASAYLRTQRAERMESAYFTGAMEDVQRRHRKPKKKTDNDDLGCGIAFGDPDHQLAWKHIERYRRSAWLDYNRAVAALSKMQKERRELDNAEYSEAVAEPDPAAPALSPRPASATIHLELTEEEMALFGKTSRLLTPDGSTEYVLRRQIPDPQPGNTGQAA